MENIDTRTMMSQAKFYESYSHYNEETGKHETWEQAVDRVMQMHFNKYQDKEQVIPFIEEATKSYKEKRVLGAQRALQFGGQALLKHEMKMYNCTSTYVDRPEFFGEVFYVLLCGAGAGFSVQHHHVAKLPDIAQRTKQAKTFVVPDSIEGWAQAVDVLMSSFFVGGGKHPEYEGRKVFFDLNEIRPKGAPVAGTGKAPGPDGLRKALDKIEQLIVSHIQEGQTRLRTVDAYDIVMHIADAVLSGGIRRAATICLFSLNDEDMMTAKTGSWYVDNPQRGRSNNSAVIVRDEVTQQQFSNIMESVKQFGEPGFVFVESTEHTTNPCVEIGMFPQFDGQSGWQGCNLTEINGDKCTSKEEFFKACRAASIIGTLQAGYTDFKFIGDISKKIFEREALLGVSITGWMNNPEILFDEETLEEGARIVREVNKEVAEIIGINQAARTTCVKPSGNASVLLETASGIHSEHSPLYIRNVQMNKESEVAQTIKRTNPYMVEESVWSANGTDYVISFPIIPREGSYFKDDLVGVDHLKLVKKAQKHWVNTGTNEELCADKGVRHNVSNTIIVDDWDKVERYVFENRYSFSGISFMAAMGDKAYNQAPNTEVITPEHLWNACATAQGYGEDISQDVSENTFKRDWVRRFVNFANNYLDGDLNKADACLKDAYLIHKWTKIQSNLKTIEWVDEIKEDRVIDMDTIAAAACSGGACEVDF